MLNIENDVSLALCQSVVTLVKAKTLVDRLSHGSELDRKLARLCGLPAGEDGTSFYSCLLYTSDAADERSSVDLGGRRIIKKKKKNIHIVHGTTPQAQRTRQHIQAQPPH